MIIHVPFIAGLDVYIILLYNSIFKIHCIHLILKNMYFKVLTEM